MLDGKYIYPVNKNKPLSGEYRGGGGVSAFGFGKVFVEDVGLISATVPNDTIEMVAGDNITLAVDESLKKLTISSVVSGGDVLCPDPTYDENIAIFDGDDTKTIKDSGLWAGEVALLYLTSPKEYQALVLDSDDDNNQYIRNSQLRIEDDSLIPSSSGGTLGKVDDHKFGYLYLYHPTNLFGIFFGNNSEANIVAQVSELSKAIYFRDWDEVCVQGGKLRVNIIDEYTSDLGVTIEGVLIEDGEIFSKKISLKNTGVDGGAVYFGNFLSSYLKANEDGTALTIGGFTSFIPASAMTIDLGSESLGFKRIHASTTRTGGEGGFIIRNTTDSQSYHMRYVASNFVRFGATGVTSEFYTLSLRGNIIVASDATYDVGASNQNFRELWLDRGATHGGKINLNNGGAYIESNSDNSLLTIANFTRISANAELLIKLYSQDAEPTITADNYCALWKDTDDSDRVYLIFRRGTGDQVKVELT